MTALLKFEQVGYWYNQGSRKKNIIKDANVAFEKGKFYTIIGASGSGKTTFLSLASALDVPKEGKILYEGQDISKIGLSKFRNQYVSIVFQSYNLLPYMTAIQNILTAMEITGSDMANKKEYAYEMLAKMGIDKADAKQRVLTLSGGQQQRVAIARALCCQSDLIVADEPTGNLDEETSEEIINIFKDLAYKENKCVLMVTHNTDIAKQSDVIIKLSKGQLSTLVKKEA
jgi:putative ABC transport system ATP-binding protein